jgi:two-component system, chemotaxis family, protein-glutamate methylesterase/glutaminase
MPVMDGLTALPLLLQAQPKIAIIISSTLSRKNAEVSLRALRIGAKDYITKPTATSEAGAAQTFRDELLAKVKALGRSRRGPPLGERRPALPHAAGGACVRPCATCPTRSPSVPRPAGRRPCSRW